MGFRLVLTAAFVIGGTIETSTSGARILLDGPRDVELLYDAGGNLIASIAPGLGTDALGNHYLQGFTTYDRTSLQWTQVVGGNVNFGPMVAGQPNTVTPGNIAGAGTGLAATSHTDVPSGRTAIAKIELDSGFQNTGGLASGSPQVSLFSASTVPLLGGIMGAFTALDPALAGTLGAHVWHNPSTAAQTYTYKAGWSAAASFHSLGGVGPLQFRFDAEDNLILYGLATAAAGAGTTLFTLPAGYFNQFKTLLDECDIDSSTHVLSRAPIAIDTTGNVLLGIAPVTGSTYAFRCCLPLGNLT